MNKAMLAGAGLLAVSLTGQAAELFLTINSASPMTQGAGLVRASQAIEQKATVHVLLCDAGGDIAVIGRDMPRRRSQAWRQYIALLQGGKNV
ncbi:MAG: hypothetical protein ACXW2U_02150 [Telluria sp.]